MSVTHFKSHIIAQGGISGAGVMGEPGSVIYYVDEEKGSNSYNGKTPDCAFATIGKLLEVCNLDTSDDALYYGFIIPGNYAEDDLYVHGHGLHLIGLGIPGRDSGVHLVAPDTLTTDYVLQILAANFELANICLESRNAKPVLKSTHLDNCRIHDCVFHGDGAATLDCMELENMRGSFIEHNKFFGFQRTGIRLTTGADHYLIESTIRKNEMGKGSVGAGLGSGAKGIFVHDQVVVYGTVIDRNHINLAGVAGSPKGIDVDATGQILITDNYVVVPADKIPIECAASPDGILNNHTLAGTVIVDPNPKATA